MDVNERVAKLLGHLSPAPNVKVLEPSYYPSRGCYVSFCGIITGLYVDCLLLFISVTASLVSGIYVFSGHVA